MLFFTIVSLNVQYHILGWQWTTDLEKRKLPENLANIFMPKDNFFPVFCNSDGMKTYDEEKLYSFILLENINFKETLNWDCKSFMSRGADL